MKKQLFRQIVQISIIATIAISVCSTVHATGGKFGFIDMGKVFNAYTKTQEADQALEGKRKIKEDERTRMLDEIKRLQGELELMSDKGRTDKQALIDEKSRKLRDFERDTREELLEERDKMARDILIEIKDVVKVYAEQEGYAFVLERGALVYGVEQADISDKITEKLNAQYKPGKVTAKK